MPLYCPKSLSTKEAEGLSFPSGTMRSSGRNLGETIKRSISGVCNQKFLSLYYKIL